MDKIIIIRNKEETFFDIHFIVNNIFYSRNGKYDFALGWNSVLVDKMDVFLRITEKINNIGYVTNLRNCRYLEVFYDNNYYSWPLENFENKVEHELYPKDSVDALLVKSLQITDDRPIGVIKDLALWQGNCNDKLGILQDYQNGQKTIRITNKKDIWKIGDKLFRFCDTVFMFVFLNNSVTTMSIIDKNIVIRVDFPKGGLLVSSDININLEEAVIDSNLAQYTLYKVTATELNKVAATKLHREFKNINVDFIKSVGKLESKQIEINPVIDFLEKFGTQLHYPHERSVLKELIEKTYPDAPFYDSILEIYEKNKGNLIYGSPYVQIMIQKMKDVILKPVEVPIVKINSESNKYNVNVDVPNIIHLSEIERIYELTNGCKFGTHDNHDKQRIYDFVSGSCRGVTDKNQLDSKLRVASAKIYGIIKDEKKQLKDEQKLEEVKLNELEPKVKQRLLTIEDFYSKVILSDYQKYVIENTNNLVNNLARYFSSWNSCVQTEESLNAIITSYKQNVKTIISSLRGDVATALIRICQKKLFGLTKTLSHDLMIQNLKLYNIISEFVHTLALHGQYNHFTEKLISKLPKGRADHILLGLGSDESKVSDIYNLLKNRVFERRCKNFLTVRSFEKWYNGLEKEYENDLYTF